MSIARRPARKSTNHAAARRQPARRGSSFRRTRKTWFSRLQAYVPGWVIWLLATAIAIAYVVFFAQVVLHFAMPRLASIGLAPEPSNYPVRGIDISHYQKTIDWDALSQATLSGHKISFVIMKATEGSTLSDHYFKKNFQKAQDKGFVCGAYPTFTHPGSPGTQAQFFISKVKLRKGDLPPVLDVEKCGRLSVSEMRRDILIWLDIVEKHYGVKPIIYANYSYTKKYFLSPEFASYPLWIAHYYKDELEYQGEWALWQYTDRGMVDGIDEYVDCNVFNGSRMELQSICIK